MYKSTNFLKKAYSLFLIFTVLSGASAVFAQKKTTQTVSQPKCSGGWSGIITFTKTRNETYDSGKTKAIPHGTNQTKTSQELKYSGRIVVDGSQNPSRVMARAQALFTDVRRKWSRHDQMDTCFYDGKDGSVPQWTEKNESDITNAFAEGEAQFWMNVYNGTYSFNFRFPQANGTNDSTYDKTAGGWCNPALNKPESSATKNPEKVDGEGAEIEDQKIDPTRPDVLSGSKTWEDGDSSGAKTVYTVTWSFKRCPAPIEVTDIRFDDHPYPDHQTWREIETTRGTVDGNRVRIRATVTNFSGETKFPIVKFNEMVENWTLPEGEKSIRLEAGESREVELEWDTSGYAWRGKGYDAESYRKIKVEAEESGQKSELTKLVVVNPRPVILAHGLWSNAAAWAGYEKFFEDGHSKAWKSYAVGANPSVAKMDTGEKFGNTAQTKTISQNAVELGKQIEFTRKELNAWHVDIVAHSMGGLIARYYIAERMPLNPLSTKPVVTKLIMLGTPNQGSPCAALMYAAFAAKGNKIWALWELIPRNVLKFNESYSRRRGVRFSALAGKAIPTTCQEPTRGDGVVSIGSARWMVKDWRYSNSLAHTELTSRADFGAFVFPRLAIGPRGNHDHEILSAENEQRQTDRYGYNSMFRKASYKTENFVSGDDSVMDDAPLEGMTLAEQIALEAGQTKDVEIPAANGSRVSVTFVAAPDVSAKLVDASGKIVGENAANSADAKQMFRTISVEKPSADGNLKLKLENPSTQNTDVFVAVFADQNPLRLSVSAGKPSAAKQIVIQAVLTNNNLPVTGAKLNARVSETSEMKLVDDGTGGDAKAGDGVYTATLPALVDGDYLIEISAETGGQSVESAASFTIGVPGEKNAATNTSAKKKRQ